MPEIDEKNMQKLTKLLAIMDEDTLTRKEFTDAFQKVIELVLKIEKRNSEAVEKLEETYHTLLNKMTQDGNNRHAELSGKVDRVFVGERMDTMAKDHKAMMTEMKDMIVRAVDKKMGEMERHVGQLKPIKGDKGEPGDIGPMPTEHLDLMREIQIELKKVKDVLSNIPRGKAMGRAKVPIVRAQNLTSQIDGVVNTFTVDPDTTAILGVFGTQFPINFNAGTDWTFAGRTLTLVTAQVGVPQSGQTLWALTEVLFSP